MSRTASLLALSFYTVVHGQQVGTVEAEVHPSIAWELCTSAGGCTTQAGQVVLDSNWRWIHSTSSDTNCFEGNEWNATLCPDPVTCAFNCALDGADYSSTYGVTTSGNALAINFIDTTYVGARLFLMANTTEYYKFQPKGQEFAFDVDVSQLPCGLDGAVYFAEMPADGGMAAYPTNKAGAKYGTGYCDSQCPRDLKFIDGRANTNGFQATGANSGEGSVGACCTELDMLQANSISAVYAAHSCTSNGLFACTGTSCTTTCDSDGCDFNPYRMGNTSFYGGGKIVDATQTFTVVTQFITADNTTTGALTEIKRFYVQNGQIIANPLSEIPGMPQYNYISNQYCAAEKVAFNDTNTFATMGGMAAIDAALTAGVVLVISVLNDPVNDMLWLDGDFPASANPSAPGVARGTCADNDGGILDPYANARATFSNIKFGNIGSTFAGTPALPIAAPSGTSTPTTTTTTTATTTATKSKKTTTTVPTTTTTSTTTSTKASKTTTTTTSTKSITSGTSSSTTSTLTTTTAGPLQTHYQECGGIGYIGPTQCEPPYTCTVLSGKSQCSAKSRLGR